MNGSKISVLRKGKKPTFGFLAHPVEDWNWLLLFRRPKSWWRLHSHPEEAKKFKFLVLARLCHVFSLVYLSGLFRLWSRCFMKVDTFDFNNKVEGKTFLVKNMGWHFFVRPQNIRKRILKAVDKMQREVDVIGLGALTKHEGLTQGGKWIVDQMKDRLKVPLVHGDTLTAVTVIKMIERIFDGFPQTPVFMTGSTSKIGRAVAIYLAQNQVHVKMFTKSISRFQDIQKEAGDYGKYMERVESLEDGAKCHLWLTGKAKPGGEKLLKYIPHEAIVLNFSVPNPLSAKTIRNNNRHDIFASGVGYLAYDTKSTDLQVTMRLWPGITYACHAGTAVHAYMGWKNHEVNAVEMEAMEKVWKAAQEIGFFLPHPKELALLNNWEFSDHMSRSNSQF